MTEPAQPRDLTGHVSSNVAINNYHNPGMGLLAADWRVPVASGEKPFTTGATLKLDEDLDVFALIPQEWGDPVRSHGYFLTKEDKLGLEVWLWENEEVSVEIEYAPASRVEINVAGITHDVALQAARDFMLKVPITEPPDDHVRIGIWNQTTQGPNCDLKRIKVPTWESIQNNYPKSISKELTKLMEMEKPGDNTSGKIILWHGPPGTGKTTALRAMARQWKDWCTMSYVSDPEKLFADPGYLREVGTNLDDESDKDPMWRLVVCEDSDEFLRARGRGEGGSASLMRLLNFSDGILGQGSNTLILITTNEPLDKLHPAVIRPGRCHSQLMFDNFTAGEATKWLADGTPATGPMSLAEMCERRDDAGRQKIENKIEEEVYGNYL